MNKIKHSMQHITANRSVYDKPALLVYETELESSILQASATINDFSEEEEWK